MVTRVKLCRLPNSTSPGSRSISPSSPAISQITVFQILLTPVTMGATAYYLAVAVVHPHTTTAVGLALLWLFMGRGIRSVAHLRRRPSDLWLLPLVTVTIMFVALPIKTWAFITMNKQGWLTRRAGLVGGEGQNAASLNRASARGGET